MPDQESGSKEEQVLQKISELSSVEMVFNANLSFAEKVLLVLGWHVQVRICGPSVQWGITRKPLTVTDTKSLDHAR